MVFSKSSYEAAMAVVYCAIDDSVSNQSGCYFSDCRSKEPSKQVFDERISENLWEISKKMVGLKL